MSKNQPKCVSSLHITYTFKCTNKMKPDCILSASHFWLSQHSVSLLSMRACLVSRLLSPWNDVACPVRSSKDLAAVSLWRKPASSFRWEKSPLLSSSMVAIRSGSALSAAERLAGSGPASVSCAGETPGPVGPIEGWGRAAAECRWGAFTKWLDADSRTLILSAL